MIAVAVAVVLCLFYTGQLGRFRNDPVAHGPKTQHAAPETPVVVRETAEEFATRTEARGREATAELLRAEVAYKHDEWRVCLQRLAAAKAIDAVVGDFPALEAECKLQDQQSGSVKMGPKH
jgi:hypothetical protein